MGIIAPFSSMNITDITLEKIIIEAVKVSGPDVQSGSSAVINSDTVVFGRNGCMDSVGLVAMIVEIERQMEEEFGITMRLMDDDAFSAKRSPFRTVSTLKQYVRNKIGKTGNGA